MKQTPRILLVSLALALGAVTTASATNISKTSGDLSDPAFWGGTLPTDRINFQCGAGNYTITRDVTFAGMYLDWTVVTIDASANNPTITMTGPIDSYQNRVFTFIGGTYDFGRTAQAFNTSSWNENFHGTFTLDGCVFTNSVGFWLQNNNRAGSHYTLQNHAALHVDGHVGFAPFSVRGAGRTLSVLSGSLLKCQRFVSDSEDTYNPTPLIVSGAGSSLVTTGASSDNWTAFGRKGSGYSLTVDDGASVDFVANSSGFYLGAEGGSYSNSVIITGGATASFPSVYLGGWAGGGHHTFKVLDNATVSTVTFRLNGDNAGVTGNELVISNATLNVLSLFADASKGDNATIRIQGENPKINISSINGGAGQFVKNTTIIFDVPTFGYTTLGAIIDAPNGGIWGNDTTTIRVNGMEECVRKMQAKTIIPLMAASTGAQFPQSVLDATNAAMPGEAQGRCEVLYKSQLTATEQALFPSANAQDLFLRIKPILATVVYIR